MEGCKAVEQEVSNFLLESEEDNYMLHSNIDNHISFLSSLKAQLEAQGDARPMSKNQIEFLQGGVTQVLASVYRMTTRHRGLHKPLVKIGKAIDKNFTQLNGLKCEITTGEGAELLNQVVVQHFYREGTLHFADKLCEEAEIIVDPIKKAPFVELSQVVEALKKRNLKPALEWIHRNQNEMTKNDSKIILEFRLHRLAFLQMIRKSPHPHSDAVAYSQKHFGRFSPRYDQEIQMLMGALIKIPGAMAASRYSHFFDNTLWDDIQKNFFRDATSGMDIPKESPLAACVDAGCKALPVTHYVSQAMSKDKPFVDVLGRNEQLPIEVDLGKEFRFHSVFSCPILRVQESDLNPPMRLSCGHVISKDAAIQILNTTDNLKCPYCIQDCDPDDVKQIVF